MTYRVRVLRKAQADVRHILAYLSERSPQGAKSWYTAYVRARKHLEQFAGGCSAADEDEAFDIRLQQFLFRTRRGLMYRLVFTITDGHEPEVRILRVRGPGQAPVEPDDV